MSKLIIKVEGAHNLIPMDILGKSDPYCVLHFESATAKTRVINSNCNPVWNETFEFPVQDFNSIVRFEIWDYDILSKPDHEGSYEVEVAYLLPGPNSMYQHLVHPKYPNGCGTISVTLDLVIPEEKLEKYRLAHSEHQEKIKL
jgi:Ca2+-dependent lipid-binding protein